MQPGGAVLWEWLLSVDSTHKQSTVWWQILQYKLTTQMHKQGHPFNLVKAAAVSMSTWEIEGRCCINCCSLFFFFTMRCDQFFNNIFLLYYNIPYKIYICVFGYNVILCVCQVLDQKQAPWCCYQSTRKLFSGSIINYQRTV